MVTGPEKAWSHQKDSGETRIVKKLIAKSPYDDFLNDWTDEDFAEIHRNNLEMYSDEEESVKKELTYIPFDPVVELKNIRKLLPHEVFLSNTEKREIYEKRLADYYENLLYQKGGISKTIDILFKTVESTPGISEQELLNIVEKFASEYKFTSESFEYPIGQYRKKHLAVEQYRKFYSEDADLFRACFGTKPEGKVEIIKGPMTLYFKCYNEEDYAFIYEFQKHNGNRNKFLFNDYLSGESGGIAIPTCLIDNLKGTIIAENVGFSTNSDKTRTHENQHQFDKLFMPAEIRYKKLEMIEQILSNENSSTEELLRKLIRSYVKFERKNMGIDTQARDEIIAYYKDGSNINDILYVLAYNELYNYKDMEPFKKQIFSIPSRVKEKLTEDITEIISVVKDGEEVRRISEKDLDVHEFEIMTHIKPIFEEEYQNDLRKWLGSINILQKKGYSRDEIISLLYSEPVYAWFKLARRMENKN